MDKDKNIKDVDDKTGDTIEITHDKLNIQELTEAVTLPQCGAIATFLGKNGFSMACILELSVLHVHVDMGFSRVRELLKRLAMA